MHRKVTLRDPAAELFLSKGGVPRALIGYREISLATAQRGRKSSKRKADGFILLRHRRRNPRIALLRKAGYPFVQFGGTENSAECAWCDIRGGRDMHHAVARLVGFGHRRIAFIGADPISPHAKMRLDGDRQGMAENGRPPLTTTGHATAEDGGAALAKLLDGDAPPTGVACATVCLATGAVRAAKARDPAVGRDISIIGHHGSRAGEMLDPHLTSFAVEQIAAGARRAGLLIARIGGADPTELRETADAVLREGGTDGTPPRD